MNGDESGEEFLSTGNGARGAGVFLEEDAPGHHVDDDGAFRLDDGRVDGGEVRSDVLGFDENRSGGRCDGNLDGWLLGTAGDKGEGDNPDEKFPKLHMAGSVPKFGSGASERSGVRGGNWLLFPNCELG